MKLHVPSVLLSLGVVGLVVLLSSQALTPVGGYRIEYLPHPRDYVQIIGTAPYLVPAGKLFVPTAIGSTSSMGSGCHVHFNVNAELAFTANLVLASEAETVKVVPPGLAVPAGSAITLTTDAGCQLYEPLMRCWGYLASQ